MLQRMLPSYSDFVKWKTTDGLSSWLDETESNCHTTLIACNSDGVSESLLLQAAVTCNTEGCHVLYITAEPLATLPPLVHGMPSPDPILMKHVKMLYMNSQKKLIDFIAELHRSLVLPDVIIIDNLHRFGEHDQHSGHHRLARLLAAICETASFLASKIQTFSHVLVSTTDTSNAGLRVCSMFITDLWVIEKMEDSQCGTTDFQMIRRCSRSTTTPAITFSIRQQDVILRELSRLSSSESSGRV